jgi:hypothetical protein
MKAADILRTQWARIYPMLEGEIADLTLDELKHAHAGATIGSILSMYLHTMLGDDALVQSMAGGGPRVWETGGWAERTGLTSQGAGIPDDQVAPMTTAQWAAFRDYAAAVRAANEAWLAAATDADLERVIDVPFMGRSMPVGEMLGSVAFFHILEHAAEISALRGVMGKTGMRG